jgi:hypothetical protein
MSLLNYLARPWVAFDVNNKEHRKHFHLFVTNKTWGKCPYRFIVPDDQGADLITIIQRKLVDYYVDKEFGKPIPVTTSRKAVQKVQKMVDKRPKK